MGLHCLDWISTTVAAAGSSRLWETFSAIHVLRFSLKSGSWLQPWILSKIFSFLFSFSFFFLKSRDVPEILFLSNYHSYKSLTREFTYVLLVPFCPAKGRMVGLAWINFNKAIFLFFKLLSSGTLLYTFICI